MKKYKVSYKIKVSAMLGMVSYKEPYVEIVEADSYGEARNVVRVKQPKAMNIEVNLVEVQDV